MNNIIDGVSTETNKHYLLICATYKLANAKVLTNNEKFNETKQIDTCWNRFYKESLLTNAKLIPEITKKSAGNRSENRPWMKE